MIRRRMFGAFLVAACAAALSVATHAWPSLALVHGTVLSMRDEQDVDEGIALSGDRILALGTDEEILGLAGPDTQIVDLAGRVVLPGFIDAHAHLLRDSAAAGMTPEEAEQMALSCGITSAAEMVVEPGDVERYAALAEAGQVRVRTQLFLAYNSLCGDVYGAWYKAYPPSTEIAPRLSIAGVKVFVERSSCGEQRPAISFSDVLRPLLSPAGTFWYGEDRPLFSIDELATVIRDAASAGFAVAMHVIGDDAVETALRAVGEAGPSAQALRPLVLHDLFVRDELLPLYDEVGAVPVVEPINACFVDTYDDMLPPAYADIVRRWGDLAALAAHLASGSDWPWGDPGSLAPLFRLANLVSRTNASPAYASWEPCESLSAGQVVSVWEALRMMTAEAAYALHCEQDVGTLAAGKQADIVILNENPLETPVAELGRLKVVMTILGGKIEWQD